MCVYEYVYSHKQRFMRIMVFNVYSYMMKIIYESVYATSTKTMHTCIVFRIDINTVLVFYTQFMTCILLVWWENRHYISEKIGSFS
jgi:hypothetical protein